MIKHLIFDWGGVCTDAHYLKAFSQRLNECTGIESSKVLQAFVKHDRRYELGTISPAEFWKRFSAELGLNIPVFEIQEMLFNTGNVDWEMLNLVLGLRKKFTTILLTNNYEDNYAFLDRKYVFRKYFDYSFSSSTIHLRKPDKKVFKFLEKKLNIKAEESLLVDDSQKNVDGAKKAGFCTILFKSIEQFKKELTNGLSWSKPHIKENNSKDH